VPSSFVYVDGLACEFVGLVLVFSVWRRLVDVGYYFLGFSLVFLVLVAECFREHFFFVSYAEEEEGCCCDD